MIRRLSGISEVADDVDAVLRLYRDVFGLSIEYEPGSGYAIAALPGVLHFGIWGRRAAAESLFGDAEAWERVPLGFLVELEVDDVAAAQAELEAQGIPLTQLRKREPWTQVTCRFMTRDGAVIGLTETPWARRLVGPPLAE